MEAPKLQTVKQPLKSKSCVAACAAMFIGFDSVDVVIEKYGYDTAPDGSATWDMKRFYRVMAENNWFPWGVETVNDYTTFDEVSKYDFSMIDLLQCYAVVGVQSTKTRLATGELAAHLVVWDCLKQKVRNPGGQDELEPIGNFKISSWHPLIYTLPYDGPPLEPMNPENWTQEYSALQVGDIIEMEYGDTLRILGSRIGSQVAVYTDKGMFKAPTGQAVNYKKFRYVHRSEGVPYINYEGIFNANAETKRN